MWSITVLTITALVFFHASGSNVVRKVDGRIVNGVDADISEVPYQLSLERNGLHCCGGSILKSDVALTAAHCYFPAYLNQYRVRAGSSIRCVGGQVVSVRRFHIHKKFVQQGDYDVAVALLADHLRVGAPVRLAPRGYQLLVRSVCLASGWGDLYEGQQYGSERLQKVELHAIGRESCQDLFLGTQRKPEITPRMICTYTYKKDTCDADSGGPLVANGMQVGIVSWGTGCAQYMIPGVYTNIGDPEIFDFIMSKSN